MEEKIVIISEKNFLCNGAKNITQLEPREELEFATSNISDWKK